MKFAHIADTHIKNLKYHYEYKMIFEQLYNKLREEQVDIIVHCGDIAHTKTQISPEFVEMCSDFFRNLAEIAPTYIILGNHDGNLKNSSRQDALTPIVDALNLPDLHLLKDSGETHVDDKFCLNVLSVFDEENWQRPSNKEKINIALYHGSISGVKTDIGWTMEHGENDISIFNKFDFGFLGDIHKTNQTLDYKGRIRYPGSTIQQNHGETNDKGILLWDIKDRNDFTCRHVAFKNPRPFVTIELTPKGRLPRGTKIPEGARLRLVSNNNLPLTRMKRALDIAKHKFRPESITFLNRAAGMRGNIDDINNKIKENLRDTAVQEKLIREYIADYEVDDELVERILTLNKKYNQLAEQEEEVSRNINWKLKSIKWDNLFNYREGNSIDFTKLNGIVGIFGKNYSGKSSIIDSILYSMFNSTSKNERKNLNVINQNKDSCTATVELAVGDTDYTIQRTSEKYVKRLKGEETLEAKTDVNFERKHQLSTHPESLNGLTRIETDKNIRKLFGTLDDFLLSSMASQLESLSFLNEGSTRRKEILAKFLDLEIFEKKYKLAKEDASDLRGALRRLQNREYEQDIAAATIELCESEDKITEHKDKCESYQTSIDKIDQRLSKIEKEINSIPVEILDIAKIRKDMSQLKTQKLSLNSKILEHKQDLKIHAGLYEKICDFLDSIDINDLRSKKGKIDELKTSITNLSIEIENVDKKATLLDGIPCGDSFPACKFIRDANVAVANRHHIEKGLHTSESKLQTLKPFEVQKHIEKYNKIMDKKTDVSARIAELNLSIERNKNSLEKVDDQITALGEKVVEYDKNKNIIDNLESLLEKSRKMRNRVDGLAEKKGECEESLTTLYVEHGSLEQKLRNLEEQKEEYHNLHEEYSAFDLYMRCMHSNGIAYDIIKRKLPIINEEIAKTLANIVNFEIYFEDDGKKLNIFIKHPKHDPRPIEMGSGAEKTIASMAIRISLLSISSLPKGDIFILDEPGTALDAENMEGFVRILDMIKNYYKTVLLISHMDALKDNADIIINIEKQGGYAYVKQ
jgi:DNA repair exonuclease SbcCD nuclease subunit